MIRPGPDADHDASVSGDTLPASAGRAEPARGDSAVVIGSGFGGLALAVRLQAAGVDVTLLEKRARVGGRAYQLVDRGYVFDMGPSLITAPEILDSVFRAGGRRITDYVDLAPLDPYYRIHFHDGTSIDYVGDHERMKAQMRRFHPGDAERLDDFMEAVKPIYDSVIGDRLGSEPFDRLGTMLGFVPKMVRMGAHRRVSGFVKKYFEDVRHQFLFSFHPLFVGGNPFTAPAIYLMIPYLEREGGVWFSRGGMYSVVQALESLFVELGGTVRTEHEVQRIEVEGGRATGVHAAGRFFPADFVVSNADVAHTYMDLVDSSHRKKWSDRRVRGQAYTMSCFLLYLGVRTQFPDVAHHTLILGERYEGLLDDIFDRKILPDDFSMYLHVPTRTDPGMAPEGCESMYVLVPVANNQSGIDWAEARDAFAQRILDFLEAWGLHGLNEQIDVLHVFTPDDFESELNAYQGNAFGVEPRFTQTAWFRPHNRSEDVDGLYLVGAGTHPGAGVPGVVLSAQATYASIAEDRGLPSQWKQASSGSARLPSDLEDRVLTLDPETATLPR